MDRQDQDNMLSERESEDERSSEPSVIGYDGYCVCPKCGRRMPRESNVPCASKFCLECEVMMYRE